MAIAQAAYREALARLSRAERDISRTEMRAPYDGRVRQQQVDVGQFVNRGAPIGTIYAVDILEIKLPIHDEELAFMNLPDRDAQGAPVRLSARFAGARRTWHGEVARTEGELDPRTKMVNVVARVPNDPETPLSVGLFVDAEIEGRRYAPISVSQSESRHLVSSKQRSKGFGAVHQRIRESLQRQASPQAFP